MPGEDIAGCSRVCKGEGLCKRECVCRCGNAVWCLRAWIAARGNRDRAREVEQEASRCWNSGARRTASEVDGALVTAYEVHALARLIHPICCCPAALLLSPVTSAPLLRTSQSGGGRTRTYPCSLRAGRSSRIQSSRMARWRPMECGSSCGVLVYPNMGHLRMPKV